MSGFSLFDADEPKVIAILQNYNVVYVLYNWLNSCA